MNKFFKGFLNGSTGVLFFMELGRMKFILDGGDIVKIPMFWQEYGTTVESPWLHLYTLIILAILWYVIYSIEIEEEKKKK